MPILPDVNREMSLNVGRQVDSSGAEQAANVYGAIGQLSQNVGQIATQVARDLHVQSAQLEASTKKANYEAETANFLESLSKDPDADFVFRGDEIEQTFKTRQQQRRQSLLDNAQSYTSRSIMEQQLASSEAEESLRLLKVKNDRISQSKNVYLDKTANSFGESLASFDTDFNKADLSYQKAINTTEATFRGYIQPDELQKYKTKLADSGAMTTLHTMIADNRLPQAALQFFGPNAKTLQDHMKLNFTNGKETFDGIGIRDEQRPGFYKIQLSNGAPPLDIKVDEEKWKKAPYMLSKIYTKMADNVFIEEDPRRIMLKDVSPSARAQMFDTIFRGLNSQPKEDSSLVSKALTSALVKAKEGQLTDKAVQELLVADKVSAMNKAQLTDLASVVAAKQLQNYTNSISDEKLAHQPELIAKLDSDFPEVVKAMAENPALEPIAIRLGDGDLEKGKRILTEELSTQKLRDQMVDFATKKSERLKREIDEDPVRVAEQSVEVIPQIKALEDRLFTNGEIMNVGSITPRDAEVFKGQRQKIQSKMNSLRDNFGARDYVLNKDRVKQLNTILTSSFSDTGKLSIVIDNLRNMYDARDFATIMEQVDRPHLAVALYTKNLDLLNELVRSEKYYSSNTKNLPDKSGDAFITLKSSIESNDTLQNYIAATANFSNSSQPKVAEAVKEAANRLALYYMNDRNLEAEEAVELATRKLVGDDNMIIRDTDWANTKNYSIIIPKSYKVEEQEALDAFDSSVGSESWLRSQNLKIPEAVKADYDAIGLEGYERFIEYAKNNRAVRNSADGTGFDMGFLDKNKKFIPLISNEGAVVSISADSLKQHVEAKRSFEKKNSWISNDAPVSISTSNIYENPTMDRNFTTGFRKKFDSPIKMEVKVRSTENFITVPHDTEVRTLQLFENPNMDKNFNKVSSKTYADGKTATTLGGALTGGALRDVAKSFNEKIPSGLTDAQVVDYYSKKITTKGEYDKYFKEYMKINRSYIKEELRGQTNSGKYLLADLSWTIGAQTVKDLGIAPLLRNRQTAEVMTKLMANPMFVANYPNQGKRLQVVKEWLKGI